MQFKNVVWAALLAATSIAQPATYDSNTTYIGPENGHLVIVGGNLQSDSIWQRIITPDQLFRGRARAIESLSANLQRSAASA